MQAGFRRVSVVRGGFPALVEAGVPVGYKDVSGTAPSVVE
jgi:hypothetical protein